MGIVKVWYFAVLTLLSTQLLNCLPHRRSRRMVNGEDAKLVDWYFTVLLVKEVDDHPLYCGGVLIKNDWILTAAHCVNGVVDSPQLLSVRIGSTKRSLLKEYTKFQYEVSKIYIHSAYNDEQIPSDDIALIKLKYPIVSNRYNFVRPIEIALWRFKGSERHSMHCQAAGWGKTKSFSSIQEMNDTKHEPSLSLQKIDVPLLGRNHCISEFDKENGTTMLSNKNLFWDKMMCGGSSNPNIGTPCLYDSGSPLVCEDIYGNRQLYGIAIAIHGPEINERPCTPGKQISVFLRVPHYAKWIIKTTKDAHEIDEK
ncbi:mite allergen Der p 3-like [Clytia hemisphaerica]